MKKRKRKDVSKEVKLPGNRKIRYFKGHKTPWVDIAKASEPYGESTFFHYLNRIRSM